MLRPDERTAWNGFRAAAPRFAGEDIASAGDGPDPPDVICASASGKTIGVELTKWVEHDQITSGRGREFFENSYLKIIASENEPRPDRIGWVWLHDKSQRIKPEDEMPFRNELFELLSKENAVPEQNPDTWQGPPMPVPSWNTRQGAPVRDFGAYPMLEKYLDDVWIFPRQKMKNLPARQSWVLFEGSGGAYRPDWMVQAAIDRVTRRDSCPFNRSFFSD